MTVRGLFAWSDLHTYKVVAGVPTYIVPSDIPGEFANWSLVLGRIKSESD